METAAKKIKIVKPGDNVMVPVPDLDREKINAHLLILVALHSDDIEDRCLVWPLSESSKYRHFPLLGPRIC